MSGTLKQHEADLRDAEEALAKLVSAPDTAENRKLKKDYEDFANLLKIHIDDELSKLTPQALEKYMQSQAAAKDAAAKKEAEAKAAASARNFYANEHIMARWISGDKSYYKAKVLSVTGSTADPVYMVRFEGYDDTETLRKGDVKPLPADKKRKFEEAQATPKHASPTQQTAPGVISAPATINPAFAAAKKEPTDGPEKPNKMPRKVKPKKELEQKKSNWQAFTAKAASSGKFKKAGLGKDSQFRTSDNPNSRVGFTGSGQPMKKDPVRKRHVYEEIQDD